MDWTLLFAGIAALAVPATVWLGWLTRDLVRASQEQVRIAQEARFDQQRPILVPDLGVPNWAADYNANMPYITVNYQNAGPGAALNIWGVIFGPEPQGGDAPNVPGHSGRQGMPLPAGRQYEDRWHQGGSMVRGTDTIAGQRLFAPQHPSLGRQLRGSIPITARLTFTCRDAFNRKHVSIFDLSPQVGWIPVYTGPADKELLDLEREHAEAIPVVGAADLDSPMVSSS